MSHDDAYATTRLCCLGHQRSSTTDLFAELNHRICAEWHRRTGCLAITLYTRFTAVLIVVALSILAASIAAVLHRRLTGAPPDLGSVSERWLAEYRADASRPSR